MAGSVLKKLSDFLKNPFGKRKTGGKRKTTKKGKGKHKARK
jgi:hypothetical protein